MIDEGRLALRIDACATGPSGAVFATRDRYDLPDDSGRAYASMIGMRDAGDESIVAGSSEGEDAGTPALMTVDVRYANAATSAKMDGNAWQTRPWASSDASGTAWEP